MSRSHLILTAAAALGAIGLLSACATTEVAEGGVRIDQQNDVHPALNSVRVIDGSLAKYVGTTGKVNSFLDVEGVYVSATPTGFKKITVQLRNKSKVAIPLEARVSWFDAGGAPADPAQSWTRLFAQPMSMVTFEQSAAKLNAAQYYVEVRGAQ